MAVQNQYIIRDKQEIGLFSVETVSRRNVDPKGVRGHMEIHGLLENGRIIKTKQTNK